jgi:hypothetical protein
LIDLEENMSHQFGTPLPSQDFYQPGEVPPGATQKRSSQTAIILAVVLFTLCCCCIILVATGGFLWSYGDQLFGITYQLLTPLLI